jgi:hypothetical protein
MIFRSGLRGRCGPRVTGQSVGPWGPETWTPEGATFWQVCWAGLEQGCVRIDADLRAEHECPPAFESGSSASRCAHAAGVLQHRLLRLRVLRRGRPATVGEKLLTCPRGGAELRRVRVDPFPWPVGETPSGVTRGRPPLSGSGKALRAVAAHTGRVRLRTTRAWGEARGLVRPHWRLSAREAVPTSPRTLRCVCSAPGAGSLAAILGPLICVSGAVVRSRRLQHGDAADPAVLDDSLGQAAVGRFARSSGPMRSTREQHARP